MVMDDLWECPGEAHELDNGFNPSAQGPYGPSYHDCEVCDNELYVTEEIYHEEIARQELMKKLMEERRQHEREIKESKATWDAIMKLPKSNIKFLK
jgi:hypothetical protein